AVRPDDAYAVAALELIVEVADDRASAVRFADAPQAQNLPSQSRRFEGDVERSFARDLACGLARLLDQFVRSINSGFGFRRARFRAATQPFKLAPRHLFQLLRFDGLALFLLPFLFQVLTVIAGEHLYPAAINFEHAICDAV